jgi:hypothetical protein
VARACLKASFDTVAVEMLDVLVQVTRVGVLVCGGYKEGNSRPTLLMLALQPSLCSVSTPQFLTLQRPHSAVSYVSLVSSASTSWLAHARLPDRNAKLESDFEVTIYKGVYRRRPWPVVVDLSEPGLLKEGRLKSVGAETMYIAVDHDRSLLMRSETELG